MRIVGERLPGRNVGERTNVHIGVQRGDDVVDVVPGDAASAIFQFPLVRRDDGDFRGPYVHGTPGDRFIYLVWVDVDPTTGDFERIGRIKLMLAAIPGGVLRPATTSLEAYLALTDQKGSLVTAAIRPPQIMWSSE